MTETSVYLYIDRYIVSACSSETSVYLYVDRYIGIYLSGMALDDGPRRTIIGGEKREEEEEEEVTQACMCRRVKQEACVNARYATTHV